MYLTAAAISARDVKESLGTTELWFSVSPASSLASGGESRGICHKSVVRIDLHIYIYIYIYIYISIYIYRF